MVRTRTLREETLQGIDMIRVSMVFAIQQWLAETPESRKTAQTPGYFAVIMSCKFPR